jgi:hypothetical protein
MARFVKSALGVTSLQQSWTGTKTIESFREGAFSGRGCFRASEKLAMPPSHAHEIESDATFSSKEFRRPTMVPDNHGTWPKCLSEA